MVRIYVVDNGGQWTHREWRTLRDLGIDTAIVANTTSYQAVRDADGLVLSGGAPRMGLEKELGNCRELLEKARVPILGICAGHQFIAHFYGGEAAPAKIPEFGKTRLMRTNVESPLFEGVPNQSIVWESHNDEVTVLPKEFECLGISEDCPIQAMQHKKEPLYGLQFHPEVEHTEYGELMFRNFIDLCKK